MFFCSIALVVLLFFQSILIVSCSLNANTNHRSLLFPRTQFTIMFIPYPIYAENLLPGLVAFDVCGLLYNAFGSGGSFLGVLFACLFVVCASLCIVVHTRHETRNTQAMVRILVVCCAVIFISNICTKPIHVFVISLIDKNNAQSKFVSVCMMARDCACGREL